MDNAMAQASARSGAFVYDLTDHKRLYAKRATKRRILASNTKLFTTAAALDKFGVRGRFATEVLGDRLPNSRGVVRGDLYMRGGGDPSFGSTSFAERAYGGGGATLQGLARAVKRAGVQRVTGSVLGDESLFDSLRGGPDSGYGVSTWVGPLSALSFNRGLARENGSAFQRRPPEFAAKRLTSALERIGVEIGRGAGVSRAGARAKPIAEVESITVGRLVRLTNQISDNFFAEMLAKHLDATPSHPGHDGRWLGGGRPLRARASARRPTSWTARASPGPTGPRRARSCASCAACTGTARSRPTSTRSRSPASTERSRTGRRTAAAAPRPARSAASAPSRATAARCRAT